MELDRTLLTAREACAYLRVSLFTLNKMEKLGMLMPFRTPGGHRRYSLEMLQEYLEASRNHSLNPPKGDSGGQRFDLRKRTPSPSSSVRGDPTATIIEFRG